VGLIYQGLLNLAVVQALARLPQSGNEIGLLLCKWPMPASSQCGLQISVSYIYMKLKRNTNIILTKK